MKPTETMIEAVARSLYQKQTQHLDSPSLFDDGGPWASDARGEAGAALTAAMPLIERAVAERIAGRLDRMSSDSSYRDPYEQTEVWMSAANIARWYPEWSKE